VPAADQDQLQNYAQVYYALQLPEHSSCIDAAAYLRQQAIIRSKLDRKGIELRLVERPFGGMVAHIAAARNVVIGP
jgi:hypothetical protein